MRQDSICFHVDFFSPIPRFAWPVIPSAVRDNKSRDLSWIGVCCWHQLPSVLSRRARRSRGRSPIITWCRPFPFVPTNILLIKSKLKLEPRAIAVGVAMSPRNLGGKYRCRPHPRPRTCMWQFLREPERVNRTVPEWRRHLTTATTSSIMWCV